MNREVFYKSLKQQGIPGLYKKLSAQQVTGMEGILNAFYLYGDKSPKTLAYALATARREVGSNMVPVREGFCKTDKTARAFVKKQGYAYSQELNGHVYYGRGLVQLTWYRNYLKEGIADDPDKALDPTFAAKILIQGLLDGRWNGRGKGLRFYLPDSGPDDLKGARRTVNITDHWEEIASYYRQFMNAIVEAGGV